MFTLNYEASYFTVFFKGFYFFHKIECQSWGCGLSTSAAYTRVFTVVADIWVRSSHGHEVFPGTLEYRNVSEHPKKKGNIPQKTWNTQENPEHPPRKPGTTPRKPGTPQNL